MKIFISTNHDQHYPVGCASIVVANNEIEARYLLDNALIERGLDPLKNAKGEHKKYKLVEVDTNTPAAKVLVDGNY